MITTKTPNTELWCGRHPNIVRLCNEHISTYWLNGHGRRSSLFRILISRIKVSRSVPSIPKLLHNQITVFQEWHICVNLSILIMFEIWYLLSEIPGRLLWRTLYWRTRTRSNFSLPRKSPEDFWSDQREEQESGCSVRLLAAWTRTQQYCHLR